MARTANNTVSTEASAGVQRPRRTPVSQRNRLSVRNQEPGYVYRIVNDIDDRIEELQERGYEICTKESVGSVGHNRVDNPSSLGSVANFSVGKGTKAIVMRQKKEYYVEDQNMKQQEINDLEQSMIQDAKRKADYGSIE